MVQALMERLGREQEVAPHGKWSLACARGVVSLPYDEQILKPAIGELGTSMCANKKGRWYYRGSDGQTTWFDRHSWRWRGV